jgi:dethiobiotin synthetase
MLLMANKGYFVIGTDTGVGKTLVSAGLTRAFLDLGLSVAAMKPIASGVIPAGRFHDQDEAFWEDVTTLDLADRHALSLQERSVYRFRMPASPHIAAAAEDVEISVSRLIDCVRTQLDRKEMLVVEGVGGLRVPLDDENYDLRDFVLSLGLPVILVVGLRLGCINHALLTLESLQTKGIPVAAWVANSGLDPEYGLVQHTVRFLEQGIGITCSAIIPQIVMASQVELDCSPSLQGFSEYMLGVEAMIGASAEILRPLAEGLNV